MLQCLTGVQKVSEFLAPARHLEGREGHHKSTASTLIVVVVVVVVDVVVDAVALVVLLDKLTHPGEARG